MNHKPCYEVLQPTRTLYSISILRQLIYSASMNTLLAHHAIHRTCALYRILLYTVMAVCAPMSYIYNRKQKAIEHKPQWTPPLQYWLEILQSRADRMSDSIKTPR